MAAGRVPTPGPQNGRYAAEPLGGPSTLTDHVAGRDALNASARRAVDLGDTIKRIDGTEVPLLAPWGRQSGGDVALAPPAPAPEKARATPARARKPAPAPDQQADKSAASAAVAEAAP